MNEVDLIPIGSLDRRNPTERKLDDVLGRINGKSSTDLSPTDQVHVLLYYFLAVVRRRSKIHRKHQYQAALFLEFSALVKIKKGNSLDPIYLEVQRAVEALEEDDQEGAKNILKGLIEEREKQFQRIQRDRRKGSGSDSGLDIEIKNILKRNIDHTWRDVLHKLERRVCWRRLNFDHLCRLNLDQGLLLV
jgi:hypothetical protein